MYSHPDHLPSPSPSFASISSMDPRRITDTELDSVFMAQHEHTLRARNLPRPPSTPTSVPSSPASSSFWSSPEPKRPFRRLPEPPKPKMRRLPEPPLSSPSSISSFASTSSSVKSSASASSSSSSGSTSTYTSYLTFDDDSDSDSDELSELSDSTWSFVEFQGKAFPLPRTSSFTSTPSGSPRHHSHSHSQLHGARSLPKPAASRSRSRGTSIHAHAHSHSQSPSPLVQRVQQSQILRELGAKELEPIGSVMEPAIVADDGAQGDWRELVDDLFMRD